MRVALVHDYLNQYGGGERVLEVLMEMFPDAPVYTLLHDDAKTGGRFRGKIAGTSFLDFQLARDHHRLFIPLMPLAARSVVIPAEYDLTISDTAGYAKGIRCANPNARHVSYIHTPLRYAWEVDNYFSNPIFKTVFRPAFFYLKQWDRWAGQQPQTLIANSRFIADKVQRYYGRKASVLYPPVDEKKFYFEPSSFPRRRESTSYFLAAGRLMHYKRFDLLIDAFARMPELQLKIVGEGPESAALKARVNRDKGTGKSNVEFLGQVSDEKLRELYSGAEAFLFPQVEDFGMVAAEAQMCGTPVIAYRAGGALEIVEEGRTGIFFDAQTPEAVVDAVRRFSSMQFDRATIAQGARRFGKERFKEELTKQLHFVYTHSQ